MDFTERARRCQEYMDALEEERTKIQVFQRELPLCLQLVTQAIETCKQQMASELSPGRADCEEISSDEPVLEEFMPLKRSPSSSEEDENIHHREAAIETERSENKPDWLRSVQLWNHEPGSLPREDLPCKPVAVDGRKAGGAFHPFYREKHVSSPAPAVAAVSSTTETTTGGGGGKGGEEEKEKEGHSLSLRKARRCWSPELHRRFLQALQQLGGSHSATPKQIRELMKVDGLTNDEVKSHLQKYRLHTRRPSSAVHSSSSSSAQTPQFLVVGGIWVPPPEYAAAAVPLNDEAATPPNGIYAPVASLPGFPNQQQQNKQQLRRSPTSPLHSEGRDSPDDNSVSDNDSGSPSTSSSSHTTSA